MSNKEDISLELTHKFIRGLLNYSVSYEDIKNGNWKYCGGNRGSHLKYYKLCFKNDDLPIHSDYCICEHFIEENCYITNGNEILILGNCCIKRFIQKSSRTCDNCGIQHRNRKVNKCNDCRKYICEECGEKCDKIKGICKKCIKYMHYCYKCNNKYYSKIKNPSNKLCQPCNEEINKRLEEEFKKREYEKKIWNINNIIKITDFNIGEIVDIDSIRFIENCWEGTYDILLKTYDTDKVFKGNYKLNEWFNKKYPNIDKNNYINTSLKIDINIKILKTYTNKYGKSTAVLDIQESDVKYIL
jgi:hypothetical protein